MKKKLLVGSIISAFAVILLASGGYAYWGLVQKNVETVEPVQGPGQSALPTIQELHNRINAERAKVGSKPLELNSGLNASAQLKADELMREGYESNPHNNRAGRAGYTYVFDNMKGCKGAAENISVTYNFGKYFDKDIYYDRTAKNTVDGWLTSKAHADTLRSADYELTGYGITNSYIVQHFCDLD